MIYRATCECGERLVSDVSPEHLDLVVSEHAAWHTRTKRQARPPVLKFSFPREGRGRAGIRGPNRGSLIPAA